MLTKLFPLFVVLYLGNFVICDVSPNLPNNTTHHNVTTDEVRTRQTPQFFAKLKEDLRRNNDDYIDTHNKSVASSTPTSTTSTEDRDGDAYFDQVNDVYRRMMHERRARHRHAHRRAGDLDKFRLTEDKIIKHHSSGIKHNMLAAGAYSRERRVPYVSAGQRLYQFRAAAEAARAAARGGVARAGGDAADTREEHLDMIPAKGNKVISLRDKGRLCQRHVLLPEGPKYDSAGAVYLRAHPAHAPRPFARTRPPRLLLPHCCNCCKKSVLGCE